LALSSNRGSGSKYGLLIQPCTHSISHEENLAEGASLVLWESRSKLDLDQLSHSMSGANIASSAVAKETCVPWILAKLAILAQEKLLGSCSKLNFEQLFHCMSIQNIILLVVI
jgi:hypothetical protein